MKQALSLIGVSFLSVVSSLAADKKPNIILILADDMRASGMNFLGKEQVQTPNLDKLAGERAKEESQTDQDERKQAEKGRCLRSEGAGGFGRWNILWEIHCTP